MRINAGICFCPGLPVVTPLLLMNGLGGWGIVTFPVVDFQESPRLLSRLQSFTSFQTDWK